MRTTLEQLVQIGHPRADAERLMAMSPIERLRALPVIGNAWSDSPIFAAADAVIRSGTLAEQVEALRKLSKTVGEPAPPLETEEQQRAEVAAYLACCC